MEIVLTQWALDSYLDMVHKKVFSTMDYKSKIRPDVLLLKKYPSHSKFKVDKFWSPIGNIKNGFKMKWHQMGNGKVQLRLCVGIFTDTFLCEAYVKRTAKFEDRRLARHKTRMELIARGKYKYCGRIN